MATITKKRLIYDVLEIQDRFSRTDESRVDETWVSWKIDQVRAQLMAASYQEFSTIDQSWYTDMGLVTFHKVNMADDPNVDYACNTISKATIPNIVSFPAKGDGNIDLGLRVTSAAGSKEFTPLPMSTWMQIPSDHVRAKFGYYFRINNALYVNKDVTQLRVYGILASPEDGYIVSSTAVSSGSIVNGTIYKVKGGTIVYRGTSYTDDDEFTGAGGTTTYTGNGTVYLKSQLTSLADTLAYPVTPDMARQIVLEICTKELKIESLQAPDKVNNSVDDEQGTD